MNRNGDNISDIVMLDAVALSSAIHMKRLSCVEVMTAYLDHIERLNMKVNAIVALEDRDGLISQATERDAQLARGDSKGALHGFPNHCELDCLGLGHAYASAMNWTNARPPPLLS